MQYHYRPWSFDRYDISEILLDLFYFHKYLRMDINCIKILILTGSKKIKNFVENIGTIS
jgi:hypothetical protein